MTFVICENKDSVQLSSYTGANNDWTSWVFRFRTFNLNPVSYTHLTLPTNREV